MCFRGVLLIPSMIHEGLSEEAREISIFRSSVNDLVSGSSPFAAKTFDLSLNWLLYPEATWGA